jgi:hypothetical protein
MEGIFEKQIDTVTEKTKDTEILLYETDLQQMLILQVWWFGVLDHHSPHQVDKDFIYLTLIQPNPVYTDSNKE